MKLTLEDFEKSYNNSFFETDIVYPVFNNKKGICLVSSDEYTKYVSVVVTSIVKNSLSGNNYDIVIVSKDMCIQNQRILKEIVENYDNISLRFFDASGISKLNLYTWGPFSVDTYCRLLIPDIFKYYETILYMDSDIVVNKDIYELLSTDINNYYLAATYDTHVVSYLNFKHGTQKEEYEKYNKEVLGMEKPDEYFQMGVCLYNVKAINSNFDQNYLISEAVKEKLRWLDQDLINKLFYGKIKYIDNNWNVMVCNNYPFLDEAYLPEELKIKYYNARLNPYIIHYIGKSIPCLTMKPDLWTIFWKYARFSPYYEILLQTMAFNASHNYWINLKNNEKLLKNNNFSIIKRIKYFLMSKISFTHDKRKYYRKKLKSI